MTGLFITLIVLTCILLIGVVLIQNSKGGGLSSQFSASNQVMGVKKTTELIEKITWGLAIALIIFSIGLSFALKSGSSGDAKDTELRDQLEKNRTAQPMKGGPAPKPAAPGNAAPTSPTPAPAPAQ